MSKKSWHLDRRAFLFGAGVTCALPYLEAMERNQNHLYGDLIKSLLHDD